MANPLIQIDETVREMTDAEYATYQGAELERQVAAQAAADRAAAAASGRAKLAALGLTDAEIAALLGA